MTPNKQLMLLPPPSGIAALPHNPNVVLRGARLGKPLALFHLIAMEWYHIIAAVATLLALFLSYKLLAPPPKKDRRAQTKDSVLFLGPCGSGKTCAFNRLRLGSVLSSVTSQNLNTAKLSIEGKSVSVTDLPGHPRIRQQMIDALSNAAAAVLFVDSTQFMASVQADDAAILHRSHCADILYRPPALSPRSALPTTPLFIRLLLDTCVYRRASHSHC